MIQNWNLTRSTRTVLRYLFGTGIGGFEVFYRQCLEFAERGPRGVSPFFIPMLIPDIAAGHVSIKYGFRGPNFCAVSACATGSHNIGLAYDAVKYGTADYAVCGGTEAPVFEMGVAGFNALKAMSTRNDEPETASRPFDATRDGFVLGEGAGILVLESLESALARGATIYAEIGGYGFSADAYHITAPDPNGNGVILAMHFRSGSGGFNPNRLININMHGTFQNRVWQTLQETNSIKKYLVTTRTISNLNSTKSMTGHMIRAAGVPL